MNNLFTQEEIDIIIESLETNNQQNLINKINLLNCHVKEVNIDYILSGAWEYLSVKPYPLTSLELNKDYFNDKIVEIFDKYIGPACSGSGDSSECYFGKIKDEEIYFYIMDDPGQTGYGCCGSITLYYSDSLKIIQENMEFIEKDYFDI